MPEVLHPFAVVEVAVSGAVELAVLHVDAAAGIVQVAVGIDSLPLRLIAEVTVIHHFAAEVEGPVALGIELHRVVVVVRFAQPDTLEAAEVVDGVLADSAAQPLVGVVLWGNRFFRIATGCTQQGKQQYQSCQKIWLFSLHVIFLLLFFIAQRQLRKNILIDLTHIRRSIGERAEAVKIGTNVGVHGKYGPFPGVFVLAGSIGYDVNRIA